MVSSNDKSFLGRVWEDLPKPHVHLGSFLLRLGLAFIFLFHGYLKLATLNDGYQWTDKLSWGTQTAVAWGETVCGAALLFGLLSRLASVGLIVIMVGASVYETGHLGFIHQSIPRPPLLAPTGSEYNFALIIMCLAVLAIGSGKVSLDHLIFRGLRRPAATAEAAQNAPVLAG